jgi:hypothetical protein
VSRPVYSRLLFENNLFVASSPLVVDFTYLSTADTIIIRDIIVNYVTAASGDYAELQRFDESRYIRSAYATESPATNPPYWHFQGRLVCPGDVTPLEGMQWVCTQGQYTIGMYGYYLTAA